MVNSESIKASEEIDESTITEILSNTEIDARIDELYDIEAEIEDQKRQKNQIAKNLIEAKEKLSNIYKNINRIKSELNSRDANEKGKLQIELRESYVKRKALIENFDEQTELFDKFPNDEELNRNYEEISSLNKAISENKYNGKLDSVSTLISSYKAPENFEPMVPSIPEMARENKVSSKEFEKKEKLMQLLKMSLSEENTLNNLNERLLEAKTIEEWNLISDSIILVELNISKKEKKKKNLEFEREELAEQIILSKESLLNLTLIETDLSIESEMNLPDLLIAEEEKTKFYADEIFNNKEIEKQEELEIITIDRKDDIIKVASSQLPQTIRDSLLVVLETEFIEQLNIRLDDNDLESNEDLSELIQISENNISEIIEVNENLASIVSNSDSEEQVEEEPSETIAETIETIEEERSTEVFATEIEGNEEETVVATDSRSEEQVEAESSETIAETIETREDERSIEVVATEIEGNEEETVVATNSRSEEQVEAESSETIAETIETREEGNSIEVIASKTKRVDQDDQFIQENSKTVEYLTSLVLEENMRNQSSEKVDEIDIVQGNDENLKEYFQKELDIAIANEKIENKYLQIKRKYSNVKFEGKSNIEAQLRELEFKERDLKMKA